MGLFDFLFGSKKKEQERRLEETRFKEQERQAPLKAENKKDSVSTTYSNNTFKKETCIEKPKTDILPVDLNASNYLDELACQCNMAFHTGNKSATIDLMKRLFNACYGRNGHKLLQISIDATQPIGLAFANIALYLNFNDEDYNSVAAENAVYCLGRGLIDKANSFCAPAIFTIMYKRRNLLKDKLISTHCSISQNRVGMPIGIMLGGNPYTSPDLKDFREQAVEEKGVAIMSYLLSLFYNTETLEYSIPTDLPYNLPSSSTIMDFIGTQKSLPYEGISLLKEGKEYFYGLFSECQETLKKMV